MPTQALSHHRSRTLRRPAGVMALAAAVLALAVGCGADQDGASQGVPRLNACALLTDDDVAAVLGAVSPEVESAERGEGAFWMANCRYQVEGPDGLVTASLLIRPHQGQSGAAQAYTDYENALSGQLGTAIQLMPVEGIGERAGWEDFGTSIGQLTVFDGPYHLIVQASATADQDQFHNAKALAGRIVPRLTAR